jgi:transcriptional regulator with XRE-family HTH domain
LALVGLGDSSSFGAVLRWYRRAAGLTHEPLAEAAGLSARTISDLEPGVSAAPRRETLDLLAQALGLPLNHRVALEAAARRRLEPVDRTRRLHNLPAELTSFVGREHEVAEVRALLAGSRLVTLTGTGGCGKTRLALQVVAAVPARLP